MSILESTTGVDIAAQLIQRFRETEGFQDFERRGRGGGAFWARGLTGSSRALLAAALAHDTQAGDLLVVAPDPSSAEDLKDDLNFLLGYGSAVVFPDPSIPPYAFQHSKVPLRAARIETLVALARPEWRSALTACTRLRVVVATAAALQSPVPKPSDLVRSVVTIRMGDTQDLDDLMRRLGAIGFSAVAQVGEYGDMSRRGGIVDIYAFGRENPLRVEFDGDEVSSLREFDTFSQRSLKNLGEVIVLPLWEWLADRDATSRALENPPPGVDAESLLAVLESIESDGTLEGIEWCFPRLGLERARLADYFEHAGGAVVLSPTFVRARQKEREKELRRYWFGARSSGVRDARAEPPDAAELAAAAEPPEDEIGPPSDPDLDRGVGSGRHVAPDGGLPPSPPEDLFWLDDPWERCLPEGAHVFVGSGGSTAEGSSSGEHSSRDTAASATGLAATAQEEETPEVRGALVELSWHTQPPERFERNLEQTREYLIRLSETVPEIHILCDTENHRDRLMDVMKRTPAQFHVGNLAAGFVALRGGFAVLTDHEIFARIRRRSTPRRFSRGLSLKELLALTPGDFVVHVEHGIGLYRGLSRLTMNGQETDCLTLEYSGGDLHYVPVDQLAVVQKYSAEEGVRPQLSKLGGKQWAQTKARVKKSIKDMAAELTRLYAVRKTLPGFRYSTDTEMQMQLEASFPYDETPDQFRAIEDVKRDMETNSPMDRLICGDVGYGKTEVAIRAAFKAVQDGKQVAVLVPTTLLAQQHFETFKERTKGFPVRIEYLSRFRTPQECKKVLVEVKEGKVDLVIGTHMLLGKTVEWKDLGLLVIDEEQLFGVAHKERLKKYRENVDVLTLTATPIPRTMHLALMGGRDMSTILTPPVDRRPIQTEIVEFRDDVIAHALMREADRGGQSFFVHNRVESIDAMAGYIGRLVPHLRMAVAHGQMRERALEGVMQRFLHGEYDVLVSTMIIESGLDLPNVNTILINRGDTFGLAQLYQLRGRVGRSARKAYAHILIPSNLVLTENAQKRLKAMEEFEDLGSGYQLALRDLEIRGAGNLLGAEQHGFIVNVGFELYCQLLDEAVRELKGVATEEKLEPRMTTDLEAFLPEDYVTDPREKINLYKTLADAKTLERVEEIAGEMADRFGKHTEPVRNLLGLRRVRILAGELRVERVVVQKTQVVLEMARELRKSEIQRCVQNLPFQVEFALGGRHRISTRPGSGGALSTALVLLRTLSAAGGH